MAFNVFISHSVSPWELAVVYALAEEAAKRGMNPFIPDRTWNPKGEIPERVLGNIRNSDSTVVIATSFGIHHDWLNQELSETFTLNKPFLLILDESIKFPDPRLEQYKINIHRDDLPATLKEAIIRLENMRLQKEQKELLSWLVVGGLLFMIFFSKKD